MEELEGIDPADIAELEASALKIVRDASTHYEISFLVPHEAAVDMLDKYEQAAEGEIMAIFSLMTLVHTVVRAVHMAMNLPYDEDQEGL